MEDFEQETAPPRVRFGPGKDQTIPLSWAESMLMDMRETRAKQFGDLLAKAAMNGHGGSK